MTFRFFDPSPNLLKPDGTILANGSVKFLESGSSTVLKATYSDPALTTANANPINTDAGGAPASPIWMEGVYRVIQYSGTNGTGTVLADDDLVTQDNIAGTVAKYSAAFATSIGYEKGAFLRKANGSGYWQNTVSGNTTDPDASGAGWVDTALEIRTDSLGIVGDGVTPVQLELADAINLVPVAGKLILGKKKTYLLAGKLTRTSDIDIDLNGSTLLGRNLTEVIEIAGNNIIIRNGIIDLDGTSECGVRKPNSAAVSSNIYFENLVIRNSKPTGPNAQGGINLSNAKNVHIKNCTLELINNASTTESNPRCPAIRFSVVEDIFISSTSIRNCTGGIFCSNGVVNLHCTDVDMTDLVDNGYYLQNLTQNISIKGGTITNAEEGVVINTSIDVNANIRIIGVAFKNCTANKAITFREGGGVTIVGCIFDGCNIAIGQSADYVGVKNFVISNNIVSNTKGIYGFLLLGSHELFNISNNVFHGFDSAATQAIRVAQAAKGIICNNTIIGNANTDTGIRYVNCTDLKILNNFIMSISAAISSTGTNTNVVVNNDGTLTGENITIRGDAPSLQLYSSDSTAELNQVIGTFSVFGADTSGGGAAVRYSQEVISANATGSIYNVDFKANGVLGGRLCANNGFSPVLPTSSTYVPSGGLWNNGGVVTIKP